MLSPALLWAGRVGGYTAAQVEEVRMVMRMLPVFFTTILFWTIYCQASCTSNQSTPLLFPPFCCMGLSCALTAAKQTLCPYLQSMPFTPLEKHTVLLCLNLDYVWRCLFHSCSTNNGLLVICPILQTSLLCVHCTKLPIILCLHVYNRLQTAHNAKVTELLRLLGVLISSHFGAILDCLTSKLWCCSLQLSQSVCSIAAGQLIQPV